MYSMDIPQNSSSQPAPAPSKPSRTMTRWVVMVLYCISLVLPISIFFIERNGLVFLEGLDPSRAAHKLFPLFGLIAYTLIWAQIIIGPHVASWAKLFPKIVRIHRLQGITAFAVATLHPLLILLANGLTSFLAKDYVSAERVPYVVLGQIQFLLLVITVLVALLRNRPWLTRHWKKIHMANYAIFVFGFIHSWQLGTDIRPTSLRYLWIFFAVSGCISIGIRVYRAVCLRQKRLVPTPSSSKYL